MQSYSEKGGLRGERYLGVFNSLKLTITKFMNVAINPEFVEDGAQCAK
jgi:hypothetical protein